MQNVKAYKNIDDMGESINTYFIYVWSHTEIIHNSVLKTVSN